ncbi:MAG TPA: hypothetical protein VK421_12400 [Pyrinomonadaceae bacterium]|nr:hypothetical protein [Pyrinomonadaceae bacterium]
MNCQEFSEHATEIARAQVMDAAARERALGHAEECGPCAARLERERAMSAALRATAESFGEVAAPARVESALLAAFRTQHAAPQETVNAQTLAPVATHGNVRAFAPRFGRRARVAVAASAIAASLILAFVVVRRAPQQQAEPSKQLASQTPPVTPAQSTPAEASVPPSPQDGPVEDSPAGDRAERPVNKGNEGGRPARVQRAAGGQSYKKSLAGAALAFNIDGGQAVFAEGDAAASESEAASLRGDAAALTDFVPISAGASSAPLDGGQVVRVEAPRAALASLGLPVDPTRANEKVKADLLLGHDGTAHAIRLVR